MRVLFPLLLTIELVGCRAKIEAENNRCSRSETAETVSDYADFSRISVEIGAGGDSHAPRQAPSSSHHKRPTTSRHRERASTSENSRLVGRWRIVEGDVTGTVQFTHGGNILFVWYHKGLGQDWTQTGSYEWSGPSTIWVQESGNYGSEGARTIEFLSEDALLVMKQCGYGFTHLFGRMERLE